MSLFRTAWLTAAATATLLAGCQKITPNITFTGASVTTSAKVMKEEAVAKSFPTGPAPKVVVELFSGAITVTRGDDGTVAAEVTKRGGGDTEEAAREMLKKIDVQTVQEGDTVRVTAKIPPNERFIGEAPAKLTVPA